MSRTKLTRFVPLSRNSITYTFPAVVTIFFIALVLYAQGADPELKVMKTGLGDGTITSDVAPLINCGNTCDQGYASTDRVTLTATADGDSTFVGWSGDCSGMTCVLDMNAPKAVTAQFDFNTAIPQITDFTPEGVGASAGTGGIRGYLNTNTRVTTPARFIAALPPAFKQNWILMSRSESLQTGTARTPRILLPSADAQAVFTIGMKEHGSYPGSHHNAIEYMQWDGVKKNFRFHEIVLDPIGEMDVITLADGTTRATFPARPRGVYVDDAKCPKCHSTRNVPSLDRTRIPHVPGTIEGTDGRTPGSIPSKNKPNWDAYDSWGGMLPFNRDRIYQGSLEAAAFRNLFNLWNWRSSPERDGVRQMLEQLQLQPSHVTGPHTITRNLNSTTDDQHIRFGFDSLSPIATTPRDVAYSFDRPSEAGSPVPQGGRYVTLRHSNPSPPVGSSNDTYANPVNDEGRAVQLFDLLGGLDGSLNGLRIADEVVTHSFATGSVPIDVRAIALAISKGCLTIDESATPNTISPALPGPVLTFFDARNGAMDIDKVRADTMRRFVGTATTTTTAATRSTNFPRRKADIQRFNLDRTGDPYLVAGENGLIQQYGGATSSDTTVIRLRQEVFRRPIEALVGIGDVSKMEGDYIDREQYGYNTNRVALYRYLLEPLGVSVDKWSMGVRGRSRTYTFADVFATYADAIEPELERSLGCDPAIPASMAACECANLITTISSTLSAFVTAVPADAVPKYTDVQRIFNKNCIECHGGLLYPPYRNYADLTRPQFQLDLSENENPPAGQDRLDRSYGRVNGTFMTNNPQTSFFYQRICPGTDPTFPPDTPCPVPAASAVDDERCPGGLMPCGGPRLSHTDIATIRRWIIGGHNNSRGDTHIHTIDGVDYDFQSAGEFTLLRGQNLEIQARQTAVETARPLDPNNHTGLVSCASLNTAAAIRVGPHRITYQPDPSGRPNPEGLQLRVDGNLTNMGADGIALPSGGRIIRTSVQGGLQIEAPGGTVIVITPNFWHDYQVWYLDIATRHARATDGVMGTIAPGSWLPALPDGSSLGPIPRGRDELHRRYVDLYEKFESAWRVSDATSLFDYASGTSTVNFTIESWPLENPQNCVVPKIPGGPSLKGPPKVLTMEVAQQHCRDIVADNAKANCVQDVMVTGEPSFAEAYLRAQQVELNKAPATPLLLTPEKFQTELTAPVSFTWNRTADLDADPLTYRHCVWQTGKRFDFKDCSVASVQKGSGGGLGGWGFPYIMLLVLIICLLLAVLLFVMKRRPVLLGFIAIILVAGVLLAAYIVKNRGASDSLAKTVSGLEAGKKYYWKVIAEDGKGGTVESETRRFELK